MPGGDDASIDHIDDLFERVPQHLLAQLHHRDVVDPRAEYAMEVDLQPTIENSHGSLQGGIAATLVDMAAGRVIIGRLGPDRVPIATLDLHIRYLTTSRVGPVRALANIVRFGGRIVVVEVDIVDVGADERHMASATVSFMLLDSLLKGRTAAPRGPG